jgi:hypothetical protein
MFTRRLVSKPILIAHNVFLIENRVISAWWYKKFQ